MFKTKESIINISTGPCASGVNFVVPSIFSELLVDIDDEGCITRFSDVNFLFHQLHLDKLNPTSLQYYIDQLRAPSGPNYFSNFTDEQIFATIKSRYCNTFSDVKRYLDNCMAETDQAKEYKRKLDEQVKEMRLNSKKKKWLDEWFDKLKNRANDSE